MDNYMLNGLDFSDFNIGCDGDGILTNMYKFNAEKGMSYCKKEIINKEGYSVREMFEISGLKYKLYNLINAKEYVTKCPIREDASEVLNFFKEHGANEHLISARKLVTSNSFLGNISRNGFEKWLKENNLNFDSLEYCSEVDSPGEKLFACEKLKIDVMIDDHKEVALFLAQNGVKVLLYDTPYNQGLVHPNITRVYNWNEIKRNIIKMKLEKDKKQLSEKKQATEKLKNYCTNIRRTITEKDKKDFVSAKHKYKMIYSILKTVMGFKFKPEVYGGDNVYYQDGYIIASNHLNSNDQYYIALALGNKHFTALAKNTVENTFRGKLGRVADNVVFVNPNSKQSKSSSMHELEKSLIKGSNILIFPEGSRKNAYDDTKGLKINAFKPGVIYLSQRTGCPILPVAIDDEFKIVRFGLPYIVDPLEDPIVACQKLQDKIEWLIDENEKVKRLK